MKKLLFILFLPFAFIMALDSTAFALKLGKNITTNNDGSFNSENSWYGPHEDEEVEPGMETGQIWDLEGFFLKGKTLTLVGGYDFKNGVKDNDGKYIKSGDLFFNIHGVDNNTTSVYNYVFDLKEITSTNHPNNSTYDIYELDNNSKFETSSVKGNFKSDPWRYDLTNSTAPKKVKDSLKVTYKSNLKDEKVGGMEGGNHYAMIFDLSFFADLFDSKPFDFDVHYTMGCGNDNILGSTRPIPIPNPEPGTFLLFGFGLIGFGAFLRKQQQKG